jgi:cation:H+ antiporter
VLIDSILLALSLALLYFGAELAVNSSEKFGLKLGLSPLAIGMILVGMGTSLPEMFVCHIASVKGSHLIALGNIVGSNLANTFFILAIASLFVDLPMAGENLKENLIFHLALAFLMIFTFWAHHSLDMVSLGYFGVFFFVYLYFVFRDMKRNKDYGLSEEEVIEPEIAKFRDKTPVLIFVMLIGFGMLFYGGDLLVNSGTSLCRTLGISEYVISVIFVSFGTSLPELITAVVAAMKKKHTDIIVGNIIGSNIFNVALILGSLGIYGTSFESSYTQEIAALFGVSVFLVFMNIAGKKLNKLTGMLMLAVYTYFIIHWTT